MTTCAQAIKNWEAKHKEDAKNAVEIKMCCQIPPITKIDKSLASLTNCEILSLSTNSIDRMISLAGMSRLRILSIGRNSIKKIEKIEDIAPTLEQLWISYNQISSLEGLTTLKKLHTLYMSNNMIKSFTELNHLATLSNLRDVVFVGNPMYEDLTDRSEARIRVIARLPQVTKVDGELVKPSDIEAAKALEFESNK